MYAEYETGNRTSYPLDAIIKVDNKYYKIVQFKGCSNCSLFKNYCKNGFISNRPTEFGNCSALFRTDDTDIMFKSIKNNNHD